jgi:hypothetical protein
MAGANRNREIRRAFYRELRAVLLLVWPVLSVLIGVMMALGMVVARIEGWALFDGFYFAFVTGLTVGYGDLVPKLLFSRIAAICTGLTGVLLTAIIASVCVRALQNAVPEDEAGS